jgi:hypothetical protein
MQKPDQTAGFIFVLHIYRMTTGGTSSFMQRFREVRLEIEKVHRTKGRFVQASRARIARGAVSCISILPNSLASGLG